VICPQKPEECCGCAACVNACPRKCISMAADDEGFLYPSVDESSCINCGMCERVCPFLNNGSVSEDPLAFAVRSLNSQVRLHSSSGGVFYHLAEFVLNQHGVVIGVAMDEDCLNARHILVEDPADLYKLRGSKYLQAEPNTLYCDIRVLLENGRFVLFSGTPCQINAMKLFLNKEYSNLYCIDMICHGVPSGLLWRKYLQYISQKIGNVVQVSFRHKRNGWRDYEISLRGESRKEYHGSKLSDPYLQLFLKNYSLRPSCYACKSKLSKASDLTLADFWSIHKVLPGFDDGYGTSLVLVRTEIGMRLFSDIAGSVKSQQVDYDSAIQGNYVEHESVKRPQERDRLFHDLSIYSFRKICKKYVKIDYNSYLKKRIIIILRSIRKKLNNQDNI
jgi:coenzyme F420-reducing hydrogenase beta subunit